MTSIGEDETVLEPDYVPDQFVDRGAEAHAIETTIETATSNAPTHLYISGPRGTGKTHLVQHLLTTADEAVQTCYVPCTRYRTQYQVLQQIQSGLTGDSVNSGHHVSDLQRMLKDQLSDVSAVVVLDEIDFLLRNDGNDLLYYLSRFPGQLSLILISATQTGLHDQLDDRVYSSLNTRTVQFEKYSTDQLKQVLRTRAEQALKPDSLHKDGLDAIASQTQNATLGRVWLKTTVDTAVDTVTEQTVESIQSKAYRRYVDTQLQEFSNHHRLLHQSLRELEEEQESPFRTGTVYDRYEDLCRTYSMGKTLSNRQISDFLKHLELLDLIEADYHYGGQKGKTREIQLSGLISEY